VTGLYPFRHGLRGPRDRFDPAVRTLGRILADHGFTGPEASPDAVPPVPRGTPPTESWEALESLRGASGGKEAGGRRRFLLLDAGREPDEVLGEILRMIDGKGPLQDAVIAVVGMPEGGAGLAPDDLRVPAWIRIPGARSSPVDLAFRARTVDLLPTLCDLLGLPVPENIDGESLVPWIDRPGSAEPDRDVYAESRSLTRSRQALLHGPWQILLTFGPGGELLSRSLRRPELDTRPSLHLLEEHPARAGGLQARLHRLAGIHGVPEPLGPARGPRRAGAPSPGLASPVLVPREAGASLREARRQEAREWLERWSRSRDDESLSRLASLADAGRAVLVASLQAGDAGRAAVPLAAIRALADPGLFPEVFAAFLRVAAGSDEATRTEYLATLSALDRGKLRDALEARSDDPSEEVRTAVAAGFRVLLFASSVPPLLRLLGDERPGVRAEAARTLESFSDAETVGRIVPALLDRLVEESREPDRQVVEACVRALQTLCGPGVGSEDGAGVDGTRLARDPEALRRWIERVRAAGGETGESGR
jgi:hypothetical protein